MCIRVRKIDFSGGNGFGDRDIGDLSGDRNVDIAFNNHRGGEFSETAQARAYEAAFQALSKHDWWKGSFLWKTFTDPRRGERDSFRILGLEAEKTMAAWYRQSDHVESKPR